MQAQNLGENRVRCDSWRKPSRFSFFKCVWVHLSLSSFTTLSPPNILPLWILSQSLQSCHHGRVKSHPALSSTLAHALIKRAKKWNQCMPDSLLIFFKSSSCWLWRSSRTEPWTGSKTHGSTEPPLWTWHGDGHKGQCSCFWATPLWCCLLSLIYHSPSQNHTATESLESPGPRASYSRATWRRLLRTISGHL